MRIKTKLVAGIGLLFVMIVAMGILSVGYIGRMSRDTQNILADNYNSLAHARTMLFALDSLPESDAARRVFEEGLARQQDNITEAHEGEITGKLVTHYENLKREFTPENLALVRGDLNEIMTLNMDSIHRKSRVAQETSIHAMWWISLVGIFCMLAALGLLLRFPRAITRPIRELTDGILEIANRNYDKRLHFDSAQEFGQVAASFNNMAEKLAEYQQSTLARILSSKKYIEAIANSIHEPIIGLDEKRNILFANDEAFTVLNLRREDVIGKPAPELALKNDLLRRLVRELIQPAASREPLKIYADNKESYFQVQYIPIRTVQTRETQVRCIGDVILLKNITEFKELDSAKTTFISTVSHELKTPISAILMSLKLLGDERVGALNEEQKALSESIRENSDRLLNITGELLKMTQVETGKLQLNPRVTKPVELINYAIAATRVQAEKYGCQIEVEYPEKISKLFVDSEKIAWVVTNLLSNAIHYSRENSRIIVGARQEGKEVEIFVQDFGKGIDPRYHKSIFDRYFRVPGTKVQGSGLGLAISKDFVEAHGGRITLDSEVGRGSRFGVVFPVR